MIDNYDSFTYNLVHYLEELSNKVTVFKNDKLDLEELEEFDNLILSPGPGIPEEAGLLKPIIKKYASTKNILGVCLGQQAIAEVFGGKITNLPEVYHGIATTIKVIDPLETLYTNLPTELSVGRYHSWGVTSPLPDSLMPTAVDKNGIIMSLRHRTYTVKGVQFHPESILTPTGKTMLKNWLDF